MLEINPDAAVAVQSELVPCESLLWAAQPDRSVVFHNEDIYLIPFSLLWGGFAIFWEAGVCGLWGNSSNTAPDFFFMLWGVPFVLIGQYVIWGRFLWAAWKKRRTFYALTTRRVLTVQEGWRRTVASSYVDTLPSVIKEAGSNGRGTIRFTPAESVFSGRRSNWGVWDGMSVGGVPVFRDIHNIEELYRTIAEQREKSRQSTRAAE